MITLPSDLNVLLLIVISIFSSTFTQQWCGKNYLPRQPVVPPGHRFPTPAWEPSDNPLFAFRCSSGVIPYTSLDKQASVVVDTRLTHLHVDGAVFVPGLSESSALDITIKMDGKILGKGRGVHPNTTINIGFSLEALSARHVAYTLECEAKFTGANSASEVISIKATSSLFILPSPRKGSVTKLDALSGGLLVDPSGTGQFEPIFPIGFFTSSGGYLDTDHGLQHLDEMKALGFNLVHPVPPYGDTNRLQSVLRRMQELGLYLMYDMRHTYQDLQSLQEEIDLIKQYPNLLLWYTADEPDGQGDPLNATTIAYDLIRRPELDSNYHPISIALNCRDFGFTDYAAGSDIILVDPYVVGVDARWSKKFGTECTNDYGCCGCDECDGVWEDVGRRVDAARWRLDVLGWARTKNVWLVPQAFGQAEHWSRIPTGREWMLQAIIGINHGAIGIVSWLYPTTSDIQSSASSLAKVLPSLAADFILNHGTSFRSFAIGRLDIGIWISDPEGEDGPEVLLTVANMNSDKHRESMILPCLRVVDWDVRLDSGIQEINLSTDGSGAVELTLNALGSAAVVFYCENLESEEGSIPHNQIAKNIEEL